MDHGKTIRKRAPRWTAMELEVLVGEMEENGQYILAAFSATVTAAGKQKIWTAITSKVCLHYYLTHAIPV